MSDRPTETTLPFPGFQRRRRHRPNGAPYLPPVITIISTTNRPASTTRRVAERYADILRTLGAEADILDLADLPTDFLFSALYQNTGRNPAFNPFVAQAARADKLVFIVPEYNNSFPGVLKAFIDGLPYPGGIRHKKAALVGLSSGPQGAALALSHLTDILHYLGTHVLANKPRLAHLDSHQPDATLLTDLQQRLLREQAEALVAF